MDRLTFEGYFCDLAMCQEIPCKYPDTGCSQRQTWERLKAYEDTGISPEDISEILSKTYGPFHISIAKLLEMARDPNTVQVVRCKECKFLQVWTSKQNKERHHWCYRLVRSDGEFRVTPDSFCSYGQKKATGESK